MDNEKSWNQWRDEASGYFKEQQWLEASNCYTEAIQRKSDDAECYLKRAVCQLRLGELQFCREDAELAVTLKGENVIQCFNVLCDSLIGLKLFSEALTVCEEGLKLDPCDPELLTVKRRCQETAEPPTKPKLERQDVEIFENYRDFIDQNPFVVGAKRLLKSHEPNEEEAEKLLQKAVKRGSAEASYLLGMMYFKGQGADRDVSKALELWKDAAAQKPYRQFDDQIKKNPGVAEAENAIGNAYSDGTGIQRDDTEAFKWIERAAKHGCRQSFSTLGSFLWNGRGCVKDEAAARMWFRRAALEHPQGEDVGHSEAHPSPNVSMEPAVEVIRLENYFIVKSLELDEAKPQMKAKMLQGFPTAKLYFKALETSSRALNLLQQLKVRESFQVLRESWRMWDVNICNNQPFFAAARQLLEKDPNDHAALYVVAMAAPEIKASEQLTLLLRCVQLDSSIPDYHLFLSRVLRAHGRFHLALQSCEEALKLLEHPDWLFLRAVLLEHLAPHEVPLEQVIEAHRLFLSSASSDHPDVPLAYYSIGFLFCLQREDAQVIPLYRKGMEAENPPIRLPYFKPIEGFPPKDMLNNYLMHRNLSRDVRSRKMPNVVDQMCVTCTKSNSLHRCGRCKRVHYCSKKCQKLNWCVHKMHCAQ